MKNSFSGVPKAAGVILVALASTILFSSGTVFAWGTSTHHDQGSLMPEALDSAPNVPGKVKREVDYDSIYMASLSPDDWRDARRKGPVRENENIHLIFTYCMNMEENAKRELRWIRDAWANGDYDNAVFRIGSAMHYIGDAIEPLHAENVRRWFEWKIPPIGSEAPLWRGEESGGYFNAKMLDTWSHYGHQQIEAYSDSDSSHPEFRTSGWFLKIDNYGQGYYGNSRTDDGSLEWFIENYFDPYMRDWIENKVNPYKDTDGSPGVSIEDNRYLYWVKTRDFQLAKQDYDNSMRLAYNGIYRALRDGEYRFQTGYENSPPPDWSYWPWPATSESDVTKASSGGGFLELFSSLPLWAVFLLGTSASALFLAFYLGKRRALPGFNVRMLRG